MIVVVFIDQEERQVEDCECCADSAGLDGQADELGEDKIGRAKPCSRLVRFS